MISQHVFSQAPTVTSFSPTSAAKGNIVTIAGTNFNGTTAVSFGGTPATSFTIISNTQIKAVVPFTTSGIVSVTQGGVSATRAGFYYLPLSGIITDFAGYWPTTTASVNSVFPDDSHNLLAFTYNGITYSTGVNDGILSGQGISYSPGYYKSLPVANIGGYNIGSSIYLAMASKVDGSSTVASASSFPGITVKDVITDGPNGLNMGTGVTNLPTSAIMSFDIHIIDSSKIFDAAPDIIITQIAQATGVNDAFRFVDINGNIVGNSITQDMTLLNKLGTYTLDLFELSPGAPFNSAICFSTFATNTTREIRLVGFKLSDFGITAANFNQVAALNVTPSGTSDYAFIAYSDALIMSPNISQNIDRTNSAICAGGTANLEVISSAAYGGALSFDWQVSTNGGASWNTITNGGIYSGATTKRLSIVGASHNYKYKATVTESGTGFSAVCDIFTIAVITPTPPTGVTVSATASTTCLNNLVSLSSSVTGGSNFFYQWETNASGAFADIPGAILKNYLPPVNATGVTSYRLKVSSGSGCVAGPISAAAVITVVGIAGITPASRCGTGIVNLGATATSGTISWYAASTGGAVLTTGGSYSPSIAATTTYYVATDATSCATGARVAVTATINSIVWAGTNTTEWSLLPNWDCGGTPPDVLPMSTNNVTIPANPAGARFPIISTTAPINDITIKAGATITVAQGGVFEIYGAIFNYGTLTATSGTISMRGSAQQTIPANVFNSNTIRNLTINNAAGVLIGGKLNVTGTYTPTAGVLTTFGHLTLKSDSLFTARVAQGTINYVIGNVNVERYIPAQRSWRLMTAPLTNSNTIYQSWQNGGVYTPGLGTLVTAPGGGPGIDAAGNSSLKKWNVSTQALVAVSNTHVPISQGTAGSADNTGYFLFIRGDRYGPNIDPAGIRKNITLLTTTGYLQTGTQNYTNLSSIAGGFSLLGNPYASPIDWNGVLSNSGTTNLKRKFYVWDPLLNQVGGYVAMDDVVTPGTFMPTPAYSSQNNYLHSSQAFYTITNTAGAATLQVKESNKVNAESSNIFGRPVGTVQTLITNLVLIDAVGNAISDGDGTRADFNTSFSGGVDDNDNIKFSNVNETFGLVRNNVFLATERRASVATKDTLFFKMSKITQRNYQFQFKPANFDDPALVAILEDSYTGKPVILSLTTPGKVNFVVNGQAASQVATRFRIVFTRSAPLPVIFSSVRASLQNEHIAVQWKIENEIAIKHYEVERSVNGRDFVKVNTTVANQNSVYGYHWLDVNANPGNNFYRIRSLGLDGVALYSVVVKVKKATSEKNMQIYPNPVDGKTISLQLSNQDKGLYIISLVNNNGQVISREEMKHTGGSASQTINLPATLPSGNYQVEINSNVTEKKVLKLLVL